MRKSKIPYHIVEKIREAKEKKLKKLNLANWGIASEKEKLNVIPDELLFLKQFSLVQFENDDDITAINNLIWGIKGKHPNSNIS